MWIYSFFILQGVLLFWYCRLFIRYSRAWDHLSLNTKKGSAFPEISVLLAFRNEQENLLSVFTSLSNQSYPNLKLFFIDDHSTDKGAEIIQRLCQENQNACYLTLPEGLSGKKSALSFAIEKLNSPWILCTDADTRMGPDWATSMMSCAEENGAVFISGPVDIDPVDTWFSRWQSLEFSGLIALGAAAIHLKRPTMCNGANILYQREAFYSVGAYEGNEHISSGDDQFLMHRMFIQFPDQIGFCKSKDALVQTQAKASLQEFISQRVRWASKNGRFERKVVNNEMIGVWLMAAVILLNLMLGLLWHFFFIAFFINLIFKMAVEYQFYKKVLPFFHREDLIRNFWISELFQIVYVFAIGLLGKFVHYEWKGRKHIPWN